MAFEGGDDDAGAGLFGGADTGAGGDAGAGGSGDAPANGAPAAGGDAGGEAGAAAPDWYEKVSAQAGEGEAASNRDWLTAKGYKDIDAVVKSARHAEKALHDKGMVAVPKEGATPEQIAAYHKAIGVPEDAKGYEIKGPEGVKLNEPLIGRLAGAAHAAGIPKGAFEKTVGEFIQAQMDEAAEMEKARDGEVAEKLKEWGGKKDEQIAHINAAARALGLTQADMQFFRGMPGGAGRALDLFAKLGAGMAEDVMSGSGKTQFGVSGPEARAQLEAMRADPDTRAKILQPGTPERARYERLNKADAEYQARQSQAA
ncbi:hypothetical protein [Sphingomonas ginsenosidimutans]|jgi:hypothetical protein|uniref:hypothetical protein n=1 Tax=Sphingomonas ginsenosidimutans TaxID=862134 RepID=UPI001DA3357A|nr:hypothetical protein [Sphingomonas ginsenosidimutans]MBY0301249.1 hypothetical protein [Sphingomonas ginsenosidimutans]